MENINTNNLKNELSKHHTVASTIGYFLGFTVSILTLVYFILNFKTIDWVAITFFSLMGLSIFVNFLKLLLKILFYFKLRVKNEKPLLNFSNDEKELFLNKKVIIKTENIKKIFATKMVETKVLFVEYYDPELEKDDEKDTNIENTIKEKGNAIGILGSFENYQQLKRIEKELERINPNIVFDIKL